MRKLLFLPLFPALFLANPAFAQEIKIPFHEWKGLPLIEVTIGNQKTIALLDTGANASLVDPSFYKFPKADACETGSISTSWSRGVVCKVTVEIVVGEKLHYRANIFEGVSQALPREVHAILSAHDLAKDKVLQFDYKKHVITIFDSKSDQAELTVARDSPREALRTTFAIE